MCAFCEGCSADWRRVALANEETGYMYNTACKYKVLLLPFVSGPMEDGHLMKGKVEELWAETVGGSVYAEEDRFARFR